MVFSIQIEDRIEELVDNWRDLVRKNMFGGVCYLLKRNMAFEIRKDYLIVRTGEKAPRELLRKPGTRPFDITGCAMKGWIMVDSSRWGKTAELEGRLDAGLDFVLTLPGKNGGK